MAKYDANKDLVMADNIMLFIVTGDTTTITGLTSFTAENTQVIAFGTSCSVEASQDTIDTSNKMSCRWQNNLAGRANYTVSSDSLYTNATGALSYDALLKAMVAGDAIAWCQAAVKDGTDCSGDSTFEIDPAQIIAGGKGLITSLSLTAGNNEAAQCSITITGSGPLFEKGA